MTTQAPSKDQLSEARRLLELCGNVLVSAMQIWPDRGGRNRLDALHIEVEAFLRTAHEPADDGRLETRFAWLIDQLQVRFNIDPKPLSAEPAELYVLREIDRHKAWPTPPPPDDLIAHAIDQLDFFSNLTNRIWPTLQALRDRLAASRPTKCAVPPKGWRCTREAGHEGPCAAVPDRPHPDTCRHSSVVNGRCGDCGTPYFGPVDRDD